VCACTFTFHHSLFPLSTRSEAHSSCSDLLSSFLSLPHLLPKIIVHLYLCPCPFLFFILVPHSFIKQPWFLNPLVLCHSSLISASYPRPGYRRVISTELAFNTVTDRTKQITRVLNYDSCSTLLSISRPALPGDFEH
jgi:hypothetical protein